MKCLAPFCICGDLGIVPSSVHCAVRTLQERVQAAKPGDPADWVVCLGASQN